MSEEELDEELKKKLKKKPDREIVVRNILEKGKGFKESEEFEKMKQRAEEAEAIIALEAEKQFQDEKKALLEKVQDEDQKAHVEEFIGDDPSKLEEIKFMTGIIKEAFEIGGIKVSSETETKKRTSGKATLAPRDEGEMGGKEWIDTLYRTMKDPSKSAQEKRQANKMLDEMWFEVLKGLAIRGRRRESYTGYQVMSCPECGNPIMAPRGTEILECDACGWKKYPKGKRTVIIRK